MIYKWFSVHRDTSVIYYTCDNFNISNPRGIGLQYLALKIYLAIQLKLIYYQRKTGLIPIGISYF
jgi:hypothetical protein